jgi:hypothetical protein
LDLRNTDFVEEKETMKYFNRVLVTLLAMVGVFSIPLPNAIAQVGSVETNSLKQDEDAKETGTSGQGGHRGLGGFCSIAPATLGQTSTPMIWHDLPMFVWDGSVSQMEVRPQNSDTVLWSIELEATASFVQYDGAPLQPGQTYDVIITTTGQTILSFQVMDARTRDRIAAKLRELEARAQEQGADDRSISFARAQYFAKLGLRSDALQEAFSTIEPGEDTIAIAALLTCDLEN